MTDPITICATGPSAGWILITIGIASLFNLIVAVWVQRGDHRGKQI